MIRFRVNIRHSPSYVKYSLLVVTCSNLVVVKCFSGELLGDESVLLNWEAPFVAYTHDR